MKRYIVTAYMQRLRYPTPPKNQSAPMTFQYFDELDDAVNFFIDQCKGLDTGCVQIWDAGIETGHLHL